MPPTAVASGLDSWQLPYSSCWQNQHLPQAMLKGTSTWSPTFSFCTSGPTCSTTPVNSWPKVMPGPGVRHGAVIQVQVGAADAGPGDPHDGVLRVQDLRHGLLVDADPQRAAVIHGEHNGGFCESDSLAYRVATVTDVGSGDARTIHGVNSSLPPPREAHAVFDDDGGALVDARAEHARVSCEAMVVTTSLPLGQADGPSDAGSFSHPLYPRGRQ